METPFSILSEKSEYGFSPVAQIKEQIDALLSILAQQEEDLREARIMLNRANTEVMLYGKQPPPDRTASLGGLSDSTLFLVVTVELPIKEQLFHETGASRFSQREVELMKTAIYNIFESALGPYCIASCCESDMAFCNILLNLLDEDTPEDTLIQGIEHVLENSIQLVKRNYGIDLIFGRSPVVHRYADLPQARIAAYQNLQQKVTISQMTNTLIVPPPKAEGYAQLPQPNAKLEKQYYQFVLERDLDMARLALQKLTTLDLRSESVSFDLAKLHFLNHVDSLLNVYGIASSDISFLYLRPLDTEKALLDLLDELFQELPGMIVSNEVLKREKMEEVAGFIRENYRDCNLCLAQLCDRFDLNQSYLSRTFKSVYDIGILDFIHTQRLLHVKELLRDPTISIDTIWMSAGYTNRRTFNRAFRRMEGMSASEYRKQLQHK